MAKKSGLGRGMDAVFLDNSLDSDKVTTLRLSQLEPRRSQPRKDFDAASLSELADSIAANGLIQPIAVRAVEGTDFYQIIAGERRWRAAKQAGLSEVPVVVLEADDRKASELALIENIQREDLSPVEEARGYQALVEEYGLTQEQAAARVGKSRAAITNSLRLLDLPDAVLSMLSEKVITAGHARALLGLTDRTQITSAALRIERDALSVRQAEALVKRLNAAASAAAADSSDPVADSYFAELERSLSDSVGLRVRISRGKRRKALSIAYSTTEELEAIIARLR